MAVKKIHKPKHIIQSVVAIFTTPFAPRSLPATLNHRSSINILTIPTGFRPLDKALGLGGLPQGKITELIGSTTAPLGGGTANIAARIASKVQRKQQPVTIIDLSHEFDPWQAERCGLAAPQLLLTRPDTAFDALTTLENAARSEGLIIVGLGIAPELLSHADPDLLKTLLGRLRTIVKASDSVFLFITSLKNNDPFDPANYPAGFPLAEIADIRLWVQDETWTHQAGIATTYKATLTVIKNNLAIAGTSADIKIKFS